MLATLRNIELDIVIFITSVESEQYCESGLVGQGEYQISLKSISTRATFVFKQVGNTLF